MSRGKQVITLIVSFLAAAAIVFFLPSILNSDTPVSVYAGAGSGSSILRQDVDRIESSPHTIYPLYSNGELVGVLSSRTVLDRFLSQIYAEQYRDQFPDSAVSLGRDVYVTSQQSYYSYENIDDEILDYLKDNSLFTLKATSVAFSDENGIYAEIYVTSRQMYEDAMQTYLSYFISPTDLAYLNNGEQTPELRTYGSRALGVTISQTITVSEDAYAPVDQILTTKDQVLDYLEYGGNTDRQYYTVQKYDTVAGVGTRNNGLSATQVMNINRDKISSVDQVLEEGMQLCVTYFTSPIDITVSMERMRQETIYPSTVYQEDSSILEGETQVVQNGVNGSRNALYSERWINGVLVSGSLISSVDTTQAQDEIIAVGTMEIPGVGTGEFRFPVDNVAISCHWGCYFNHRAIDVKNSYDPYGNVYAADRGVIEENDYNSVNGNYVTINHNNGLHTYYGHLYSRSPLQPGTIVDKGDVIGQIGMTGNATGPHTHFFIFDDDRNRYDPCAAFLDCTGL